MYIKNLNTAKYGLYPDPELEMIQKIAKFGIETGIKSFGSTTVVFLLSSFHSLVDQTSRVLIEELYDVIPMITVYLLLPA